MTVDDSAVAKNSCHENTKLCKKYDCIWIWKFIKEDNKFLHLTGSTNCSREEGGRCIYQQNLKYHHRNLTLDISCIIWLKCHCSESVKHDSSTYPIANQLALILQTSVLQDILFFFFFQSHTQKEHFWWGWGWAVAGGGVINIESISLHFCFLGASHYSSAGRGTKMRKIFSTFVGGGVKDFFHFRGRDKIFFSTFWGVGRTIFFHFRSGIMLFWRKRLKTFCAMHSHKDFPWHIYQCVISLLSLCVFIQHYGSWHF